MNTLIRILLVDDHAVVRSGLRLLLEAHPDLVVIGEASSGETAISFCRELQPDLILMDIGLRGSNGLETTRSLLAEHPSIRVLILTMHEDDDYFSEALAVGASGYVLKESTPSELLAGIRAVAAGGGIFHPALARRMAAGHSNHSADKCALTDREREILRLTAAGCSSREVGEKLYISPRTVERHRSNLVSKLGLHSRTDLIRYAVELGLGKSC